VTDRERFDARQLVLRRTHDLAMGGLAGFAASFVLGLLLLRYVEHVAVAFLLGGAGAILGAWGLHAVEGGRPGVTGWRVAAWTVLIGSVAFVGVVLFALEQAFG
jgi:hypothetical protein